MGTRVDFYIDREWIGSLALDGSRIHKMEERHADKSDDNRCCWRVKTATSEAEFRRAVADLLKINDDATVPSDGWPWPWDDSRTTDRAVAFTGGAVKHYAWGKELVDGNDEAEGPELPGGWPDMTDVQSVVLGTKRDGVIVLGK